MKIIKHIFNDCVTLQLCNLCSAGGIGHFCFRSASGSLQHRLVAEKCCLTWVNITWPVQLFFAFFIDAQGELLFPIRILFVLFFSVYVCSVCVGIFMNSFQQLY